MTTVITAGQIKELRDRTGVGMSKCKEALEEAKGDMDQAIAILRKAGMASAVKKQGRETKEGQVCVKDTADVVALAEINAETDFVVKNERFQEFCRNILDEIIATKPSSIERFLEQPYSKDPSITIEQYRSLIIQTIGENIQISRISLLPKSKDHSVGIYSHLGGKIVTCVELSAPGLADLAKEIAMHVAATAPEYLSEKDIPADVIEKEREIGRSQIQDKPAQIVEKIVDGKINAFFETVCLTNQKYVKDSSMTVDAFIKQKNKDLSIVRFMRWMVGQS